MSDSDYTPLACSLHDELEALAVRRERVRIRFRDADGDAGERQVEGIIADIWSEDGTEYLRTDRGTAIRLDRLLEVVAGRRRIAFQTLHGSPSSSEEPVVGYVS